MTLSENPVRTLACLVILASSTLAAQAPKGAPTVADATRFLARAERELDSLGVRASRAQWVQKNFITDDTEILNAEASRDLAVAVQHLATEARRYERAPLSAELKRKFLLLKLSLSAPPPADASKATELSKLAAGLDADYGKGTYCRKSKADPARQECLQQQDLSRILAESRDLNELLDAWRGWHTISVPMKPRYARFVELSNEGARGLGFTDAGAMWRSGYDMSADAFAADMDRVWNQLRPLYLSLHAYVRAKLVEKYGASVVPPSGPIPAHLLGNMWAQEWGTIYDIVAPKGTTSSVDVTQLLKAKNVDELQMVHYGENFFKSLGFAPLPETFWKRSLFLKPKDRDVVCHASAWDVDSREDLRVKICIERTAEFFQTVHHELGHNFYQRAYN
ncbi:MAG: M2 family metallopeptidase, partial [Gemmatimonadales bacterium]